MDNLHYIYSEMMVIFSYNSETHQICCTGLSVPRHLQQNHTVADMRRALWRSSSPTPCSKQDKLQQTAHNHALLGVEYLQKLKFHFFGLLLLVLKYFSTQRNKHV